MFKSLLSDYQCFSDQASNLISHMARQIPAQITRQNTKTLVLGLNKV